MVADSAVEVRHVRYRYVGSFDAGSDQGLTDDDPPRGSVVAYLNPSRPRQCRMSHLGVTLAVRRG
jgi:hypothetical protein